MTDKQLESLYNQGDGRFYRRDGTPYSDFMLWAMDFEKKAYRRVRRTRLFWGGEVSTIWSGIAAGYVDGDGRPLIFESIVFSPFRFDYAMDMNRYPSEADAIQGHKELVLKWSLPRGVFIAGLSMTKALIRRLTRRN